MAHAYGPAPHGCIVSGHGFSDDGLEWTWSPVQPYGRNVTHQNGEVVSYASLERPFLLFEDGDPVALYTGALMFPKKGQPVVGVDYSFTLMQPVGG